MMTLEAVEKRTRRARRAEVLSELAYQACLEADDDGLPYRVYEACRAAAYRALIAEADATEREAQYWADFWAQCFAELQ